MGCLLCEHDPGGKGQVRPRGAQRQAERLQMPRQQRLNTGALCRPVGDRVPTGLPQAAGVSFGWRSLEGSWMWSWVPSQPRPGCVCSVAGRCEVSQNTQQAPSCFVPLHLVVPASTLNRACISNEDEAFEFHTKGCRAVCCGS